MPTVTIPKEYERKRSLVAIPKKEYEAFLAQRRTQSVGATKARPKKLTTAEREMQEVLAMIQEAEQDYQAGRTRTIKSADELFLS